MWPFTASRGPEEGRISEERLLVVCGPRDAGGLVEKIARAGERGWAGNNEQ